LSGMFLASPFVVGRARLSNPWSIEDRTTTSSGAAPVAGNVRRAIVVLIVDDDEDNRELYAECLSTHGMHILCAGNGAEGVQKAREARPELIVMDLCMPVMGGLEALAELKLDERTRDIPVVVLSCNAITEHARATRAGCSASLSKPCLPEDLETVVTSLVESRRMAHAPHVGP
jgi:two-component system cell cycle response regulator DivK